jgi:hypothetical protein
MRHKHNILLEVRDELAHKLRVLVHARGWRTLLVALGVARRVEHMNGVALGAQGLDYVVIGGAGDKGAGDEDEGWCHLDGVMSWTFACGIRGDEVL